MNGRVPFEESPHLFSLKSAFEHLEDGRLNGTAFRALVERVQARLCAAGRNLWRLEPELKQHPELRRPFERAALILDELYTSTGAILDSSENGQARAGLLLFERVLAALDTLETSIREELARAA